MVKLNNVLLIGATGFLGEYLADTYKPTVATTRFEDSKTEWKKYTGIDTVWLTARCCRRKTPRRDSITMHREISGIRNIVAVFKHCRILYTSTKVVYGLTDNDVRPVHREHIGNLFMHPHQGFINVPDTNHVTVNLNGLSDEHMIYAKTKLACEALVATAPRHSIYRIWDIID